MQVKTKGLEVQLAEARQKQAEATAAQASAAAAVAMEAAQARERAAVQEIEACSASLNEYKQTIGKSSEVRTDR